MKDRSQNKRTLMEQTIQKEKTTSKIEWTTAISGESRDNTVFPQKDAMKKNKEQERAF